MSNQPTLLIVDDESGILDTLRILLKKEGFEVTTAQGGKAGLEAIKNGTPDLVLTDVRMPQVTGLDILTAAREQDPMTPVILMTAQASLQTAIAAVNAGAYYYIQKPFANDELLAILRRAAEFRSVRVENKQLKQEIKRRDKAPVHDWRDLQVIKNLIVGPEHEGFEIYPAESRLVDTANQYHVFVFLDPKVRLPVGFRTREVTGAEQAAAVGARQRDFHSAV